jgi:hypothetical protein
MPLVGTIDQNTAIQEQIFSATSLGFAPSQEAPQAFAEAIVASTAIDRRQPSTSWLAPPASCPRRSIEDGEERPEDYAVTAFNVRWCGASG